MRQIYHPQTGAFAAVDDDAAGHFAASGWLTVEDHLANEAERLAREEQQAAEAKALLKQQQRSAKSGQAGEEA